jgi:hypothetical protein
MPQTSSLDRSCLCGNKKDTTTSYLTTPGTTGATQYNERLLLSINKDALAQQIKYHAMPNMQF